MRHNYTYQAFGTLEKATDTIESQHLFRGENFDKGIGSYYLRNRYYDENIGRFTAKDSYEGRTNEPVTLHLYVYVNNLSVVNL